MNPTPDKLALHSQLIALILRSLVHAGLTRIDLCSSQFLSDFKGGPLDDGDFERHFIDVMKWLNAEGLVRHSDKGLYNGNDKGACYSLCSLTALTLQILDTKIPALNGMTTKDAIVESEKPGSPASNYVRAGSFLGGLFGGFTKAIS